MKKCILTFILALFLPLLLNTQTVYADVADEQESIAESKADEAVSNVENWGNKAGDRYDQLMEQIKNGEVGTQYDGDWWKSIVYGYYKGYQTFKFISPFLVAISWFFGFLIVFISKNNKKIRKRAIIWLIVVIPLLIVIAVFGLGYVNGRAF